MSIKPTIKDHDNNMKLRHQYADALAFYVQKFVENLKPNYTYNVTKMFLIELVDYCKWLLSLIVGYGRYQHTFENLVESVSGRKVSITIDLNLFYTFIGMHVTEMDELHLKNLLDLQSFIEFLLTNLLDSIDVFDQLAANSLGFTHAQLAPRQYQSPTPPRQYQAPTHPRQYQDPTPPRQYQVYSVAAPVVTPSVAAPVAPIPTRTVYGAPFIPKPLSQRTSSPSTSVTSALESWLRESGTTDGVIFEVLRKYRSDPGFVDTFLTHVPNRQPIGWKVNYQNGLLQPDNNTPFAVDFIGPRLTEYWIYVSYVLGEPKSWHKVDLETLVRFYLRHLMFMRLIKQIDPKNIDTWRPNPDDKFYLPNGYRYWAFNADMSGCRPTTWFVERETAPGVWNMTEYINYVYPK